MEQKLLHTNTFVHSGVISKINGDSLIVSLDEDVHCESCRAKSICGISDSASKQVEVSKPEGSFRLNETVAVLLKKGLGFKAVVWAYILPFAIMVFTLVTTSFFVAEWMAGLLSLAVLVPYFMLLHILRDTFKKTFKISILRT